MVVRKRSHRKAEIAKKIGPVLPFFDPVPDRSTLFTTIETKSTGKHLAALDIYRSVLQIVIFSFSLHVHAYAYARTVRMNACYAGRYEIER